MGFFDDLRKAWAEGYENGKTNCEKHNKWKEEENEYNANDDKKECIIQNVIKGINIARLSFEKKEIDLQLKYGKNSNEDKKELCTRKEDVRRRFEDLRRPSSSDDEKNEIEEFVDRYNAHRDERVALCISYLKHPRATDKGIETALKILIRSPYCRNEKEVREDYANLKQRFNIYQQRLANKNTLNVLEYCFLSHLITDTEMIPMDDSYLSEQWSMDMTSYVMTCRNTVSYNDQMYGTHLSNLNFYKLSISYNSDVEDTRNDILSEIFVQYLRE